MIGLLAGWLQIVYGNTSIYTGMESQESLITEYDSSNRMVINADYIQALHTSELPIEITGEKGFCDITEKDNSLLEILHNLILTYYRLFSEKLRPSPLLVIHDTNTGKFWNLFWYPDGQVYGEALTSLPGIDYQVVLSTKIVLANFIENRVVMTEVNENNQCINSIDPHDPILIFLSLQSLNRFSAIRYQNEFGEHVYVFVGADGKIHYLSFLEAQNRYAIYHEQQLEKLILGDGLPAGGGELKIKQSMMGKKKSRATGGNKKINSITPKGGWPLLKTDQGLPIIDRPKKQFITNQFMSDKNIELQYLVSRLKRRIRNAFFERVTNLKKSHSTETVSEFFYDTYHLLKTGAGFNTSKAQDNFILWMQGRKSLRWVSTQLLSDQKALNKQLKTITKTECILAPIIEGIEDIDAFLTDSPVTLIPLIHNLNINWDDPLSDEVMADVTHYIELEYPADEVDQPSDLVTVLSLTHNLATRSLPPRPEPDYQEPEQCEQGYYQKPRPLGLRVTDHHSQPAIQTPENPVHYSSVRLITPQRTAPVKVSLDVEGVSVTLEGAADEELASLIGQLTLKRKKKSPAITPPEALSITGSSLSSSPNEPHALTAPSTQRLPEDVTGLDSVLGSLHNQEEKMFKGAEKLPSDPSSTPDINSDDSNEDYIIMQPQQ